MEEIRKNNMCEELTDDMLESVAGGFSVGDTVNIRSVQIQYCPRCGKLLTNYNATITGIRGVLNGNVIYWITRDCCGYKTSEIETAFVK